jgi:hypothetical protein
MFDEEQQSEDMKAFEAALAGLRPAADKLDPRWRFLLAQEAALNHNLPANDVLAASQFVCSRCGAASSGRRNRRRWAWPAAFSAMTTVAAVLLVALVVRVAPQVAPGNGQGISPTSAASAAVEKQADPTVWFARGNPSQRSPVSGGDETAYLSLRDQVLRFGVESWKPPASVETAATNTAEPVLSYREQLDRLLKQESFPGS